MVLYLAALVGIDPSYYEAAQIDGASRMAANPLYHDSFPDAYDHRAYAAAGRKNYERRFRHVLFASWRQCRNL